MKSPRIALTVLFLFMSRLAWAEDAGIRVADRTPELDQEIEKIRQKSWFKEFSQAQQQSCVIVWSRFYWFRKCASLFLEAGPKERNKYGTQAACEVLGNGASLRVVDLQEAPEPLAEIEKQQAAASANDPLTWVFERKACTWKAIVEITVSGEFQQYRITVKEQDGRAIVTEATRSTEFSSDAFRLERQDGEVRNALDELMWKARVERNKTAPEFEKLLPAEKYFVYRAENMKKVLAAKPDQEVTYAVVTREDRPLGEELRFVFLTLAVRKQDGKWLVSRASLDKEAAAAFQTKIDVADFVTRFIKAPTLERSKMLAEGTITSLPVTGVVSLERPIDPYRVSPRGASKWEVRCALTHSEDFGYLKKKWIMFTFRVMKEGGEFKISGAGF